MKVRTFGLLAVVASLAAIPVTADAGSARDRATGGGQLTSVNQNGGGAMDTFSFTAQSRDIDNGTTNPATGQVQVVRRSDGTKFHGVVTCLAVFGSGKSVGKAYMSGYQKNDPAIPFEAYVQDGGAGATERSGDMGMVWHGEETEENEPDQQTPANMPTGLPEDEFCGIEEDPKNEVALARGNYQVYDGTPGENPTPDPQSRSAAGATSALSLTGLR